MTWSSYEYSKNVWQGYSYWSSIIWPKTTNLQCCLFQVLDRCQVRWQSQLCYGLANIYKWNHLMVHKNIPSSRYNRFVPTRQINIVRFGWVLANTFSKSLCLFMFGKVMKPIPIKLLRVHKNLWLSCNNTIVIKNIIYN